MRNLLLLIFICLSPTLSYTSTVNILPNSTATLSKHYELVWTEIYRIDRAIESASEKYRIDKKLIRAVIRAESNFDPSAVSGMGAEGLMQLMPKTAEQLGVYNALNIEENIEGGVRYLREMIDRFDSLYLGLIAYNWGPGNLSKYGSGYMPSSTLRYVTKIFKEWTG